MWGKKIHHFLQEHKTAQTLQKSLSDIKDELPCTSQQFPSQVFKYNTENEDACPSRKLNTKASTALTMRQRVKHQKMLITREEDRQGQNIQPWKAAPDHSHTPSRLLHPQRVLLSARPVLTWSAVVPSWVGRRLISLVLGHNAKFCGQQKTMLH